MLLALLALALVLVLGGIGVYTREKPAASFNSAVEMDVAEIEHGPLPVFGARQRRARIVGVVVGPDGKPRSGAWVTVMPSQRQSVERLDLQPRAVTRSGEDGEFTLVPQSPGTYVVTATAMGLLPAHVKASGGRCSRRFDP